ncbi:FAD-binding and (Fe-S)-binding domain-containing protein [Ochrobactrum sp. SFR4]|uniref:FAD-binding and (Fe-S)-binding domain-containing protein n=1 Tax=Ochrobactrum sp. SFR4 TaxID=2717368 RepID=UPI001C8C7CAA|nr:FAD-binding and (Fe-S)-binding domain-containing protein [Ochrobactrum sp. SFR4]MBX8827408.1 FAD-binding oxidoreductase [Ochrobactrum sp. SFR4]
MAFQTSILAESIDSEAVRSFEEKLIEYGLQGAVRTTRPSRVVNATDNSIYYVEPICVVEAQNAADVVAVVKAAAMSGLSITARGGGTGTNGQSLTRGVVLDTSRFMNHILDFNAEIQIVKVQPGVVLDQLNAYLRPHGYFFPPAVSTSSRATIGGMVATDASGKGSRIYGRTSDYLVSAEVVLSDGTSTTICDLPPKTEPPTGLLSNAVALLRKELPHLTDEIARVFPKINRGLTGYNLDELRGPDGTLRLTKLIAGSEGTLAVTTELALRVVKLPPYRGMAVIGFPDSVSALSSVADLLVADPEAIEFLDDRTVELGKSTNSWSMVQPFLGAELSTCGGYLFAEVSDTSPDGVAVRLHRLEATALDVQVKAKGVVATQDMKVMAALNALRKDAVGLMGKGSGALKGVAFVEDAAVPPENLVKFVSGFREILNSHQLDFGMYGHADVGCVHVRPLMDMRKHEHRDKVRPISDAVAQLAREHGGLIWGEHGKGVRSEYIPDYFGPRLYGLLRQIKTAFDPDNRFNPGKLVTANVTDLQVDRIDEVTFRGTRDSKIAAYAAYGKATDCNGNGACFHWDSAYEMCPSYKVTRDRVQSPKGRAALIRDWLYARETGGDEGKAADALDVSLRTCLSCKACATQCPVQVDIPDMKARFLSERYSNQPRPRRDRLVRHMEDLILLASRLPVIANLGLRLAKPVLEKSFGLVDLPRFATRPLIARMQLAGARCLPPGKSLPADVDKAKAVILLSDSFLGPFEPAVLESAARVMRRVGIQVFHTPILRNGKALHVRGYLNQFEAVRLAAVQTIEAYSAYGLPLITIEPAITMLYRQDYRDALGADTITSLDQFLVGVTTMLPKAAGGSFSIIGHCTECAADPAHLDRWKQIFAAAELDLSIIRSGCCGMAGLFGHEIEICRTKYSILVGVN